MLIDKIIDFKGLLNIELSCISEETSEFLIPIKKGKKSIEHYVDNDIEKVSYKITDAYKKMIINAIEDSYSSLKDNYIQPAVEELDNDTEIMTTAFYKSANYSLCYFVVENEYDLNFLGLTDRKTGNYIFIGTAAEHPYIITNKFTYGNSDGSGPQINDLIGDKFTPQRLLAVMLLYFSEFTNNMHH